MPAHESFGLVSTREDFATRSHRLERDDNGTYRSTGVPSPRRTVIVLL
jgi:hypothetical protein